MPTGTPGHFAGGVKGGDADDKPSYDTATNTFRKKGKKKGPPPPKGKQAPPQQSDDSQNVPPQFNNGY